MQTTRHKDYREWPRRVIECLERNHFKKSAVNIFYCGINQFEWSYICGK